MIPNVDDIELTDADVQEYLDEGLRDFPHLKAFLPKGYPQGTAYRVTHEQLAHYSKGLHDTYWHQLNLPLAVSVYRGGSDADARSLMGSILRTLDNFVARLGMLPGAAKEVAPLWEDAWSPAPRLWSIVAGAHVALCYQNAGIEILGFGQFIGVGPKDADIRVRMKGRIAHVEIEAWHKAEFGAATDEEVRTALQERAQKKATDKFPTLPDNEVGVVAEVCVVRDGDVKRALALNLLPLPNWKEDTVFWTPWRLVGLRGQNGLFFSILPL